jgi:hypothetical protein
MLGGLAPGRYTLDAVQLDSAGNQGASASHTITVLAPPSPQPPAASFTWFPSSPHAGETVTLVSTLSSPRSPVTNLAWDLAGNGRFSQSGPVVTTTFTTPGRHLVQLRATDAEGASGVTSQVIVVAAPQLVLMQPFPIVRIAGRETAAGVSLSLVQVTAPVNATVTISCHGRGCPTRRQTRVARAGRHGSSSGSVTVVFRRFAHSLRAGTVLVFRVTAPGEIGKYTRFSIRRHRLPLRFDGCVGPIDPNPIRCPS